MAEAIALSGDESKVKFKLKGPWLLLICPLRGESVCSIAFAGLLGPSQGELKGSLGETVLVPDFQFNGSLLPIDFDRTEIIL